MFCDRVALAVGLFPETRPEPRRPWRQKPRRQLVTETGMLDRFHLSPLPIGEDAISLWHGKSFGELSSGS
jgi:hypothetical protein